MHPNTDRALASYEESLTILREHGFNPIAVCQMMFEDTFAFETDEEAYEAYKELEQDKDLICGWFYGRERFMEAIKEYEVLVNYDCTPQIYWLDEQV